MSEELQGWVALIVTIAIFIWLIIALYPKNDKIKINITVNIMDTKDEDDNSSDKQLKPNK